MVLVVQFLDSASESQTQPQLEQANLSVFFNIPRGPRIARSFPPFLFELTIVPGRSLTQQTAGNNESFRCGWSFLVISTVPVLDKTSRLDQGGQRQIALNV